MSKCLILVPARFGSSRFPGKPLAKINDIPMIHYVINNCKQTGFDYAIVTDSDDIEQSVKEINGHVVRCDDDVATGSERIALAYKRFFADRAYELVINVQGDEPLLSSDSISKVANEHSKSEFDIFTAVKKRNSDTDKEDYQNSNIVKAVKSSESGQCFYFSRQSIPMSRDNEPIEWFQHIGIYSYRPQALLDFVKAPMARLEDIEKLEQLRALELGMTIGACELDLNLIGVDTPEDIVKIQGVLRG